MIKTLLVTNFKFFYQIKGSEFDSHISSLGLCNLVYVISIMHVSRSVKTNSELFPLFQINEQLLRENQPFIWYQSRKSGV